MLLKNRQLSHKYQFIKNVFFPNAFSASAKGKTGCTTPVVSVLSQVCLCGWDNKSRTGETSPLGPVGNIPFHGHRHKGTSSAEGVAQPCSLLFQVKPVDVKRLVGSSSAFTGTTNSISMAHIWSNIPEAASMTLVCWTPSLQKNVTEKQRCDMLRTLLKFLALFRATANKKVPQVCDDIHN